jgi:protein-disulfide isomerase
VARAREGLAAGRKLVEVILELRELVLLDVFADYTHPALPETWARAEEAMAHYQQHRLVLRTPGASAEARRAVALAECARRSGRFGVVHRSLVDHRGPWDTGDLLDLAEHHGLARDDTSKCLVEVEVSAQIQKDFEHAAERGFSSLPGLSVNRSPVADEPTALRAAIQAVLQRESI